MNTKVRVSLAAALLLATPVIDAQAATGDFDPSFGDAGVVIATIGSGTDSSVDAVVAPDGKVIVVGQSHDGQKLDFANAKLNADGSFDPSYGDGGKVITNFYGGNDEAFCAAVHTDGRLVVAGRSMLDDWDSAVALYLPDGQADTNFGGGLGYVTRDIGIGAADRAADVAFQSDGKILLAGFFGVNQADEGGHTAIITRLDSNGVLDPTFSGDGTTVFQPFPSMEASTQFYAIAVQPDGKIVAAGSAQSADDSDLDIVVARFMPDGSPDLSFSDGGFATLSYGVEDEPGASESDEAAMAIALQPDGKIVVGGYSNFSQNRVFAVARFDTDGTEDLSFSNNGSLLVDPAVPSGASSSAHSIAIQDDGKILVAGQFGRGIGVTPSFAVVRFYSDGSIDKSFAPGTRFFPGILRGQFADDGNVGNWILVQDDRKILVGGAASGEDNLDFAIARIEPGDRSLSIEQWRMLHFGTSEPVGLAADDMDGDGDGLTNLIEWLTGTDPTKPSQLPLEVGGKVGDFIELFYNRRPPSTSGEYRLVIQRSNDLSNANSWTSDSSGGAVLSDDGTIQRMRFVMRYADPAAPRFVRLSAISVK